MLNYFKEYQLSKIHGFFAVMGGFARYDDGEGPYVIDPDGLEDHLRKDDITEEAIMDRSKGDALSKGIAILQTGWFILQCIARKTQGLPVTELEVVTLAFAVLNFAVYTLWWNKPLDVQVPFIVRDRDELGNQKVSKGNSPEDFTWPVVRVRIMSMLSMTKHAIRSTMDSTGRLPGAMVRLISNVKRAMIQSTCKLPGAIGRAVLEMPVISCSRHPRSQNRNNIRVAVVASFVIAYFPFIPRFLPVGPFWDMLGIDDADEAVGSKTKGVSMFYCGRLTASDRKVAFLLGLLFATIFGVLHCIAWSFKFPTPLEQLLWRMASLVITCLPPSGIGFLVILPLLFDRNTGLTERYRGWVAAVLLPIGLSLSVMYLFARIALLVIAFTSLRSPAPGTFHTVQWTTFIPHI
jgi:hypothetical protein